MLDEVKVEQSIEDNEVAQVSPSFFSDEYIVSAKVNGVMLDFALDTCSRNNMVDEEVYQKYFSKTPLLSPNTHLLLYIGHSVELLGKIPVKVQYEDQEKELFLFVAKGNRTPLFGRTWLTEIGLNWRQIFSVDEVLTNQQL